MTYGRGDTECGEGDPVCPLRAPILRKRWQTLSHGQLLGGGVSSLGHPGPANYLGLCPFHLVSLPLDSLLQPGYSAAVKLDHLLPNVIIFHALGHSLGLDLAERRQKLRAESGTPFPHDSPNGLYA